MVQKNETKQLAFPLYYLLPDLMCSILLHSFHISTSFKVFPFKYMKHILASGPELQAVRFGYVILGENVKRGRILKSFLIDVQLLGVNCLAQGKNSRFSNPAGSEFQTSDLSVSGPTCLITRLPADMHLLS
jgi:hypothetical protein